MVEQGLGISDGKGRQALTADNTQLTAPRVLSELKKCGVTHIQNAAAPRIPNTAINIINLCIFIFHLVIYSISGMQLAITKATMPSTHNLALVLCLLVATPQHSLFIILLIVYSSASNPIILAM